MREVEIPNLKKYLKKEYPEFKRKSQLDDVFTIAWLKSKVVH